MSKAAATAKTADFLRAMQVQEELPVATPAAPTLAAAEPAAVTAPSAAAAPKRAKVPRAKVTTARDGLKHFGGYLDDETMEKIALLRIRLKMDNSQLIARAIDELAKKHNAKRAFGDA